MNRDEIRCFLLVPENRAEESYRRYGTGSSCSSSRGYHDAAVVVGEVSRDMSRVWDEIFSPDEELRRDPRWPHRCDCGYIFKPEDPYQHSFHRLYRPAYCREALNNPSVPPYTPSEAEVRLTTLGNARVGAMYHADWYRDGDVRPGPDGHVLIVKTPGGDWIVDGPTKQGGRWVREGIPPLITVTPSIGYQNEDGTYRFHAWLKHGSLLPVE